MKGNTSRANKQCSERRIIPMELIGSNSTILPFLESLRNSPLSIKDIIFNMAVSILRKNGFVSIENNTITGENPFLLEILEAFSQNFDSDLLNTEFPLSQPDFLDIAYQSLLKEGDKNQTGSYYTPESLTKKIPDINDTTTFLDPCCGTGNFLLAASSRIQDPSMLYGVDTDETACFIAKIKLIYRFRHIKFMPNIYNTDYLSMPETSQRFDVIATNPPWGAKVSKRHAKNCKHITSGESFSYFIVKTKVLLRKQGQCFFILPVSILNVSAHKDIRKYILENFHIKEIRCLGQIFSGVVTDVISLHLVQPSNFEKKTSVFNGKEELQISQTIFSENKKYNFTLFSEQDHSIIKKIYSVPHSTLEHSTWGLGIVTGDNEGYLHSVSTQGSEKIYTGKHIVQFALRDTDKHIVYDRNLLQQTAGEDIYRAEEKLVYKFISKRLVFALDTKQSLFLNSANILIPKIPNYSIKAALAFLNSILFQYLYQKKFNEIKILKGNLLQLPFPHITSETCKRLEEIIDDIIQNNSVSPRQELNSIVFQSFGLTAQEINHITRQLVS